MARSLWVECVMNGHEAGYRGNPSLAVGKRYWVGGVVSVQGSALLVVDSEWGRPLLQEARFFGAMVGDVPQGWKVSVWLDHEYPAEIAMGYPALVEGGMARIVDLEEGEPDSTATFLLEQFLARFVDLVDVTAEHLVGGAGGDLIALAELGERELALENLEWSLASSGNNVSPSHWGEFEELNQLGARLGLLLNGSEDLEA